MSLNENNEVTDAYSNLFVFMNLMVVAVEIAQFEG
jgi:hypothetical protein